MFEIRAISQDSLASSRLILQPLQASELRLVIAPMRRRQAARGCRALFRQIGYLKNGRRHRQRAQIEPAKVYRSSNREGD